MLLNCALEKVNELLVVSSLRTRACSNSLGTVGSLGGGDSMRGGHSHQEYICTLALMGAILRAGPTLQTVTV